MTSLRREERHFDTNLIYRHLGHVVKKPLIYSLPQFRARNMTYLIRCRRQVLPHRVKIQVNNKLYVDFISTPRNSKNVVLSKCFGANYLARLRVQTRTAIACHRLKIEKSMLIAVRNCSLTCGCTHQKLGSGYLEWEVINRGKREWVVKGDSNIGSSKNQNYGVFETTGWACGIQLGLRTPG